MPTPTRLIPSLCQLSGVERACLPPRCCSAAHTSFASRAPIRPRTCSAIYIYHRAYHASVSRTGDCAAALGCGGRFDPDLVLLRRAGPTLAGAFAGCAAEECIRLGRECLAQMESCQSVRRSILGSLFFFSFGPMSRGDCARIGRQEGPSAGSGFWDWQQSRSTNQPSGV